MLGSENGVNRGGYMFTFETTDQKEVRRFRIAQFNGRTATVRAGGTTVTGHVRSVVERKSSIPASWSITLVPTGPKPRTGVPRSVSRIRAFSEDVY
jgi:hypothetical protein